MTVIEADGEYTQPLVVDSVNIYAGEPLALSPESVSKNPSR